MLKKIIITLLLFNLCNCGFTVVHKEDEDKSVFNEDLAAIRIKKDRDHTSQELKNHLYDLLNPDYIKSEPRYFLILETNVTTSGTFITATGASGRNRVNINVRYTLRSLETGKKISSGNASNWDNYDVETNRFGTYTADEYIQSNLTKIVAQDIRNSLVNDLIEMRKICEEDSEGNFTTIKSIEKENVEDKDSEIQKECPLIKEEL